MKSNDVLEIGNTLFIIRVANRYLGIISFINNHNKDNGNIYETQPDYLIAYELKTKSIDDDYNTEILKARSILVMRNEILRNLNADFDNHSLLELIKLKSDVSELTKERAACHTPFIELYVFFRAICANLHREDANIRLLAGQMKILADTLVSKWFVYRIAETLPTEISQVPEENDYYCLKKYRELLELSENFTVGKKTTKIDWEGVDWESILIVPKDSLIVWCSIFTSLVMNCLRHGYHGENKIIYIKIKTRIRNGQNYVEIINKSKKEERTNTADLELDDENVKDNMKNGITQRAAQYFFDEYGYSFPNPICKFQYYIVRLPLEPKSMIRERRD
jgi:hypothetical protein